MQAKNTIIFLAFILVVSAVAIGLGVVYQKTRKYSEPLENSVFKILNSKTIPFVTAYGDIVNIDGKNITISSKEDNLTVKIRDDAPVYSFESQVQKIIKVEDLRKGDKISVNLKISQDGQAEGLAIVLITPAVK